MDEPSVSGIRLNPDLKTLPVQKPLRPEQQRSLLFLLRNAIGLWQKLFTGLLTWHLRCVRMTGNERCSGEPLALLYRGHGENLEYLKRLFFRDSVSVENLGNYPPWQAHRLDPQASACDIVCCERPLLWSLLAPPAPFRRYLCWVKQSIPIPDSRDTLINGMRRKTRMEAERMIRKYGFTANLVPAESHVRIFYEELYRPYIQSRFGDEGVVVDFSVFRRKCKDARLMLVQQDERLMGGLVLHQQGKTLIDGWTGVRMQNGAPEIPGISDVIDYCSQFIAYQEGFDLLDMGTSRALLSDGTLRYKQRWGAQLSAGIIPKGSWSVAFLNQSPAVKACIQNAGLIGKSSGQGLVTCQLNARGEPEDVPLRKTMD